MPLIVDDLGDHVECHKLAGIRLTGTVDTSVRNMHGKVLETAKMDYRKSII
ncbi:hypothetical protein P3T23_008463 [Paraburkholderia sp. GAS448]|uniref:hypothetical protein n=1 Tax=Paraburkholderia sp. GAS448 TaxID=3035136 RepID=UPI003D1B96D9